MVILEEGRDVEGEHRKRGRLIYSLPLLMFSSNWSPQAYPKSHKKQGDNHHVAIPLSFFRVPTLTPARKELCLLVLFLPIGITTFVIHVHLLRITLLPSAYCSDNRWLVFCVILWRVPVSQRARLRVDPALIFLVPFCLMCRNTGFTLCSLFGKWARTAAFGTGVLGHSATSVVPGHSCQGTCG